MANQIAEVPKYVISKKTQVVIWVSSLIGLLTFVVGLKQSPERIWHSYLTSFFYFTSISLSGLFFIMIHTVSNAGWTVNIRRVPEAFTAFLPWALGAMLLLFVGADVLFPWMRPEAVNDALIQAKKAYLNEAFFAIRSIVFFVLWIFISSKLVGNSLKQDQSGDVSLTHKSMKYAVGGIIVFALTYSLFSVDLMMSLDPHWFSTIFGVYCFSGLFQSGLAMMLLFLISLIKSGHLKNFVNENHIHDVAKYMFAFTVFYAYIGFSQYLLIWYANLPEETVFFIHRSHGGWEWITLSLLILKFAVPFLLLAPRWAKRTYGHLIFVSFWILIMQYVDFYWLVYPNLHVNMPQLFPEKPIFSFYEVGVFLGFLGLFLLSTHRFLVKHSLVPIKDPRIEESMHHHI